MKIGAYLLAFGLCLTLASAQDLEPRAYVRVPIDFNLVGAGASFSGGNILTDPTLPLRDLRAQVFTGSLQIGRTFSLFDKTAQAIVMLPFSYVAAEASIEGQPGSVDRTGFGDMLVRVSWLPVGAPAKSIDSFKTVARAPIIGVSLTMVAPTGQAFSDKLINIGMHRWSFKPEVALSLPIDDHVLFDLYGALWMFTDNPSFYPGTATRSQDPMGTVQAHLSYNFTPLMWIAGSCTYYIGGKSYVDGVEVGDLQSNLRVGGTFVFPLSRQHVLRLAASTGAIVRFGANFTTVAIGWQTAFQ